jgi:hypothetical protein
MSNKEPGYVYILTNPSFREDWVKIGKSSHILLIGTFMPEEHRNTSGAYQGAKYFSYNRKVLDEIRKEFESRSTSL